MVNGVPGVVSTQAMIMGQNHDLKQGRWVTFEVCKILMHGEGVMSLQHMKSQTDNEFQRDGGKRSVRLSTEHVHYSVSFE